MLPINLRSLPTLRHAGWLRLLLGHRILNGAAVGVGLALLSVLVYLVGGAWVAASASFGMLIVSIGDQTAPASGKLRQMAPLLLLAAPISLAVQLADALPNQATLAVGLLIGLCGFIGMLGTAWGVRGAPVGFALLLAAVFALSTPPLPDRRALIEHVLLFQVGAMLYAAYAVLSARVLNLRFRTQALAEALNELASMLRQQGRRIAATADRRENPLGSLLADQATLAERLQTARDLVLDDPREPRELRLVGMLIAAIRLREHALACELELDLQASRGTMDMTVAQANALEESWRDFAERIDRVCWSLFTGRRLPPKWSEALAATRREAPATVPPSLDASVCAMLQEMDDLLRLADRDGIALDPALAAQARDWPRFRSSTRWPLAPLARAMRGSSPVLRYALRVAIALLVGYAVALHLPWAAHPHWILLTIAVVMRTNIAQTLERRNARLIGTLIGCVVVMAILSLHPPVPLQLLLLAFGAAVAHGFAQVRYLVAAIGATLLALMQGHLLHTSGEFALWERLADTLIGTGLAWAFSYVLPAWERRQLPTLLSRLRKAQLDHAQVALGGADLTAGNTDWRLARREVHESLATIATAAQRARAEPLGVQPPLDLLERVQLRSYRLLAQLGGLRMWREQPQALPQEQVAPLLSEHLARITAALESTSEPGSTDSAAPTETRTETVTSHESARELLQRLRDAADEARALGADLAAAATWETARLAEKHR